MAPQLWERLKEAIKSRAFEEQVQPLPPPVQVVEIAEEELQLYDGSDPNCPISDGDIQSSSRHDMLEVFRKFRELGEMEDDHSIERKWENMPIDILFEIFKSFNISELTSDIAKVCSTWRLACCDPLLWKTLDLTTLKSNFIKNGRSDEMLTRVLKIALHRSRGNINTLIFSFDVSPSNEQLTNTAKSCPQLKRLVLPAENKVKSGGLIKVIPMWKDLESLIISIKDPTFIMEAIVKAIAKNCKNFSELKIMGLCDIFLASTLAKHLPKLKVLSLRCSMLYKDALIHILDCLEHLEVLNISHCLLMEDSTRFMKELDESILNKVSQKKASRLRVFLTCMEDQCILCQRTKNEKGIRWNQYKHKDERWKADEASCYFDVSSLDL